jgi:hypothetical protein
MAGLPTVESQFDLRVEQLAESVLVPLKNELRHTMSKAYPYTHRAHLPHQQTRRGHLALMNLRALQAKAEGGL